jgi:hypothetical protein
MKLSTHFDSAEFASKDGASFDADGYPVLANLTVLCRDVLEPIYAYFGASSMEIVSGHRSRAHNASKDVGGKKFSQHIYGTAADIRITGVTTTELYCGVKKLQAAGLLPRLKGLGWYGPSYLSIHVDVGDLAPPEARRTGFTLWPDSNGNYPDCTGVKLPPLPEEDEVDTEARQRIAKLRRDMTTVNDAQNKMLITLAGELRLNAKDDAGRDRVDKVLGDIAQAQQKAIAALEAADD